MRRCRVQRRLNGPRRRGSESHGVQRDHPARGVPDALACDRRGLRLPWLPGLVGRAARRSDLAGGAGGPRGADPSGGPRRREVWRAAGDDPGRGPRVRLSLRRRRHSGHLHPARLPHRIPVPHGDHHLCCLRRGGPAGDALHWRRRQRGCDVGVHGGLARDPEPPGWRVGGRLRGLHWHEPRPGRRCAGQRPHHHRLLGGAALGRRGRCPRLDRLRRRRRNVHGFVLPRRVRGRVRGRRDRVLHGRLLPGPGAARAGAVGAVGPRGRRHADRGGGRAVPGRDQCRRKSALRPGLHARHRLRHRVYRCGHDLQGRHAGLRHWGGREPDRHGVAPGIHGHRLCLRHLQLHLP
mmetsp:Transcript_29416/g.69952  ORF Transcript_29416/g.69952 Transcript_29416/m.69952 type:complete len:350 (+) Transcript_29416:5641-6690(+)